MPRSEFRRIVDTLVDGVTIINMRGLIVRAGVAGDPDGWEDLGALIKANGSANYQAENRSLNSVVCQA